MTVKIFLDFILTAQEPSRCSTMIQAYTLTKTITAKRSDVFFYWMLPDWITDKDREWLPKHDNIRYIWCTQHKDRTKEYITVRDEFDNLIAFNGEFWDFDILITVRSGSIPLLKMILTSPRQETHAWTKEVWLVEEMPMLKFKASVATLNPQVQELWTLSGYLAAENVWIMSYHEKPRIVDSAKDWFPPSKVREIDAKITPVVPVQLKEFNKKDPKNFFRPDEDKPFLIAYVGRLAAGDTNLDKIYNMMTNNWIIKGANKVRMLVLTVSTGGAGAPKKDQGHIEVKRAPREEFWRICREDMHAVIVMHMEAGFSLSLVEPMMFGVPALVIDRPWATAMLGPDYPFYISTEMDAYTLTRAMYDDYPAMYAKFNKWYDEYFQPVFSARFQSDLMYKLIEDKIDLYQNTVLAKFAHKFPGRANNEIVKEVLKAVADKDEFVLFDVLRALAEEGTLRSLQQKLEVSDRQRRGLVWATAWNDFRLVLKAFYGWEDASTTVGHMRRVK